MKRSKFGKQFVLLVTALLVGGVLVIPATAQVLADNEPGSFLVYPRFVVGGAPPAETEIRITNTGGASVSVRFNFICPGTKDPSVPCNVLDIHVDLTPHETAVLSLNGGPSPADAFDPDFQVINVVPPCVTDGMGPPVPAVGFVVAFAQSAGAPISYNHLIGSYHIQAGPGPARVGENAIAIQSPHPDFTPLGDSNGGLRFGSINREWDGGGDYAHLGTSLFTDFLASDGPTTGSRLNLLTLDIRAGQQNPPVVAAIDFWNAVETPFSTTLEFVCYVSVPLEDINANFAADLLTTPVGSLQITPLENCPWPGACGPLKPYNAAILGSITEFQPASATERTLYHDNVQRATVFYPR
jgi:hypothetical protein